ncbi:MAG: ATP phosphoribosyltransferase regulatory subunit [Eubacteriales bacterium]
MNAINRLPKDEELYLTLRELYESYGYQKYTMQKFEEYALYADHKNFLTSQSVLTFTEPGGKLLALRPDVTLSIVKNTKADGDYTEKLYYRENVYRPDRSSKSFREIGQIGVEIIGNLDRYESAEIVTLAAKSLSAVDPDFVLSLSHTGFMAGLLDYAAVDKATDRELVADCLRSANTHELASFLMAHGVEQSYIDRLSELILFRGGFADALNLAAKLAVTPPMKKAVSDLAQVYANLSGSEFASSLRLDLTVQNDLDYYYGLILQGFVKGCPKAVLTGGRYDKLLRKFNRPIGAMGFALFLGEILSCYPTPVDYDFDVLLLYSDDTDPARLSAKANELREAGNRVRIARTPPGQLKYKETVEMFGQGKAGSEEC